MFTAEDMPKYGFIDVLKRIIDSKDFELCSDEDELSGKHTSICVYRGGLFVGKLRWPSNDKPASADPELIEALNSKVEKVSFQGITMIKTSNPDDLPKVIKEVNLTKEQAKFFAKEILKS